MNVCMYVNGKGENNKWALRDMPKKYIVLQDEHYFIFSCLRVSVCTCACAPA